MKLQIPVNDDYALEVTFQNVEPAVRPTSAQRSTARRAPQKAIEPEPEREAPVDAAPAEPPPAPPAAPESVPQASEDQPDPDQSDAAQSDADGLPAEIRQLPPKQIEFYHRKLDEYREIYSEDKARTMALAIVQQVAGLH